MTVHLIPYPVAATLAEAIGVACLQLQDTDGKRLPARPGQLNDLLLAAVKAIEGVVMCERPDSAVAMMPPPRPPGSLQSVLATLRSAGEARVERLDAGAVVPTGDLETDVGKRWSRP